MKLLPLLMQPPMAQASFENKKTITRRVITNKNSRCTTLYEGYGWDAFDWNSVTVDGIKGNCHYLHLSTPGNDTRHRVYPKIYPPDFWNDERAAGCIIWVRETWYPKDISDEPPGNIAHYKGADEFASDKWKPGIHMPFEYCRLFLKVKQVKAERLHDISEEDAIKEGIENIWGGPDGYKNYLSNDVGAHCGAKYSFETLWIKINGRKSWDANPWVWAIGYEQIDPGEIPLDVMIAYAEKINSQKKPKNISQKR